LGYENSCYAVDTNKPQYNKELEYEDTHQVEIHTFKIFNISDIWNIIIEKLLF